jgi:hypothetical protein
MEHWRGVLPVPLLEIDYEATVADLESTARKLVDHCGLEWDPACLEFHRTQRPVRTASVSQVRQPVYSRSVARWKRYQGSIGPWLDQLPSAAGEGGEEAPGSGQQEAPGGQSEINGPQCGVPGTAGPAGAPSAAAASECLLTSGGGRTTIA